ncbi:beta-galactosidase-1-like protein 2 isoform X2 [Cricetulus griseus]|nr:beta-galactosidase-1-like protein 2 isoform X2 [Cricetulus griseus]XP_035312823.1 beta-galactosidase-1-like protein 2 isoform X2 [Cricetulus griseus]
MASEEGLWVILCPGPYIGSDLDLGGLPSWLLRDPKMKLRTTYSGFTKAMNRYFDGLVPRIAQFQYKKGGPIIAVQIENEYGSYYMDKKYMAYVQKALVSRGISELLMTADDGLNVRKGHLKNVLATVHMKNIKKQTYEDLKSIQGKSPILMMVYTTKTFDTWGALRNFGDPQMLMKDVREMFLLGFSFNFYMFHGGTNFGFIGGAQSSHGYQPVVTSYDYCALLTEAGQYTPEYRVFQEFFHSITEASTFIQPQLALGTAYSSLTVIYFMTLWEVLPLLDRPTKSAKPISMEQLPVNQRNGQSFGYTLYETTIFSGGRLFSRGHIQDRGQVFLDNNYIGVLDHYHNELLIVKNASKKTQSLSILVENQGRLTYGKDINKERKGLTGDIYLKKTPLRKFTIHSLEMKNTLIQTKLPKFPESWKSVAGQVEGPAFFLSHLRVGDPPQDTYVKVKDWGKGVIFINGQILGRYWSIGPQKALYIPSSWLHPGINEIVMFEELNGGQKIQFTSEPDLGH